MRNAAGGWSTPAASSGQTNERYTGRVTFGGARGGGRRAGLGHAVRSVASDSFPEDLFKTFFVGYNNNDHNTIILRANSDTARRSVVSGASVRAVLLRGSVVSGASVRARS
eukprot:1181580-Prorocentrum_minimum.AAC.6